MVDGQGEKQRAIRKVARPRGPKRLEYLPQEVRGIAGAEILTTVKQLTRLMEYMQSNAEHRPPFVRLGASVPAAKGGRKFRPSATYAVDVDGQVSVLRRKGDPRRARLWVQCERRPWNLCRDARFAAPHSEPRTSARIVTLAVLDAGEGAELGWLGDNLPTALRPDVQVTRVWPCHPRHDAGGADRAFVVEGLGEWWGGRDIPELAGIREAHGEIVSAEVGTLWIGPGGVVEFPAYSYADSELLSMVGDVSNDPIEYLRTRLAEQLRPRVCGQVIMANAAIPESAVREKVVRAVASLDIRVASLANVDALLARLVEELIRGRGVRA